MKRFLEDYAWAILEGVAAIVCTGFVIAGNDIALIGVFVWSFAAGHAIALANDRRKDREMEESHLSK